VSRHGDGGDATRTRLDAALRSVKPPVAAVLGMAIGRLGSDVTAQAAHRSCLVIAPHPDDETLGCGVTIMRRLAAGARVHVVVVSDGATWPPWNAPADNVALRDAELHRACAVLGLGSDAVTHLSFPESELHLAGDPLLDVLADALREHAPDDVLATSEADPHSDHAALGRAIRRVSAGTAARLLSYPIWQWERPRSWLRTVRTATRPELVRTDGYLERKREAIAVYESQLSSGAGRAKTEGLEPWFLRRFLGGGEMFFPVQPASSDPGGRST
jgi:LmbE family N-acetylglucosaminyl deacetylase